MKILVCGGRDFDDRGLLEEELTYLMCEHEITAIIHGAARGADSLAGEFARDYLIQEIRFPADWKKDGKAAGPIRNQRMLDEGKPDFVVAFPGGTGTADMVKRAMAAGIKVKFIP